MDSGLIFVVLIPLAILVGLLIRYAAGSFDHGRLRDYVESRDGEVIDIRWSPFGPGWFGEKSDRIYQVRYIDRDGNEHDAYAKTSMWTGVYFTEDHIVRHGKAPIHEDEIETLEEENARLRAEVERLKRHKGNDDDHRIKPL